MQDSISYEQPLNERIRTFLRLEHYFQQIYHFLQSDSAWDTEVSITALVSILEILERNDIRSEILKEMERQMTGLSKLANTPELDKIRLATTIENLTQQIRNLQKGPSKMAMELRENELVNSIRQRTAIAAGTCGFDIPAYHYLLNQSPTTRVDQLKHWLAEFHPLKEGIHFILSMIRNSTLFETHTADQGFYQKSLDTHVPCQLVRILLPRTTSIYPEISGSRHRINIRFLNFSQHARAKQIDHSIEFEMSCCAI